jgi:hypothetical protein
MRCAISRSVASLALPNTASSITRWRVTSCVTSGRSASSGKVVMRSTAALTSSSFTVGCAPRASSMRTTPTPSAATEVTRSMPSRPSICSSTFCTIASSTSSGAAPG